MRSFNKIYEVRMMLRANKLYLNALTIDKLLNRESNCVKTTEEDADEDIIVESGREFIMDAPRFNECPDVSKADMELSLNVNGDMGNIHN